MSLLVQLIARYSDWLYLICLVGVAVFGHAYWLARRRRQQALFRLERELALREKSRALLMMALFIGLGVGVYAVNRWVAPGLPLQPITQARPTPSGVFVTSPPVPTRPPPTATATARPTLQPSATPLPSATPTATRSRRPTPMPTKASAGVPPHCPNPLASLAVPGDGAEVSGVVEVYGRAQLEDFSFYKFELKGAGTGDVWITLVTYESPASGFLGTWDARPFAPGPYLFRLVVVKPDGNYKMCAVSLTIHTSPP
jgi:hypothetical protein